MLYLLVAPNAISIKGFELLGALDGADVCSLLICDPIGASLSKVQTLGEPMVEHVSKLHGVSMPYLMVAPMPSPPKVGGNWYS